MDLTCYLHPSWAPRIRPASSKRDWMDATPERFAYRCLPLAIANAHGWEIGSPCGFRARWKGGKAAEAVEIELDRDADPRHAPVALFGAGTLTFHVEGLFRTSPGWNLWVGGPPNAMKHGLAPLTGVIETDWSPYTFTMNWRFTKPGEWVRFEQDEPFCYLFPLQRGVLDGVEPVIRPLSDAPELEHDFTTWSASRDAFQKHVGRTRPKAPADKWQKLYYRGVGPDGEPGPPDHQSKLHVASFTPGAETARCPMARETQIAPPRALKPEATTTAIMSAATAHPIDPAALALTLNSIGFDAPQRPSVLPGLPGRPAAPALAPPRLELPAPLAGRDAERASWRNRNTERHRALSPLPASVPRLRDVAADAFLDLFYAAGRPVILEGIAAAWPATSLWSPEYLSQRIGDAPITYQGGRASAADFELAKDRHTRTMPFDRYITEVTGGAGGNDAYITAYNNAANARAFAPLTVDLDHLPYLTNAGGMLWIGPAGTFTPLHHDLTNNLLVQVVGRKRVHLLPPCETGKLANSRHVFSDVHDIEDPTQLAKHPIAGSAHCVTADLEAGDALFIPVGWWHQVRSLSFSVMLTYTDFIWPNDSYNDFPKND